MGLSFEYNENGYRGCEIQKLRMFDVNTHSTVNRNIWEARTKACRHKVFPKAVLFCTIFLLFDYNLVGIFQFILFLCMVRNCLIRFNSERGKFKYFPENSALRWLNIYFRIGDSYIFSIQYTVDSIQDSWIGHKQCWWLYHL